MTDSQTDSPSDSDTSPIPPQIVHRALDLVQSDASAVRALLQAAVNVELFTIPLYMCAMKSIQGMHAINAKDVDYYEGRVWPGRSIGRIPGKDPAKTDAENEAEIANQSSYNSIFSVFIDEMLHLQLAANLCATLGLKPDFNSPALQDEQYNWTCYGAGKTIIPHIIDLQDLNTSPSVTDIRLADLSPDQLALFLTIEQNNEVAHRDLKPDPKHAYFPDAPFPKWKANSTETDLPMFGTISCMYECLLQYTTIEYVDGLTLWEKMFAGQRDLFNGSSKGHPLPEYPKMPSQIGAAAALQAQLQAIEMVLAICDQGEGGIDKAKIDAYVDRVHETARKRGLMLARPLAMLKASVLDQFQPDQHALEQNYPTYTDAGGPLPYSEDAAARVDNGKIPHFDRFKQIQDEWIGKVVTWKHWHEAGNTWKADMLKAPGSTDAPAKFNIPDRETVATALNKLKGSSKATLDNVVQGALAGITTVLSTSWSDPSVAFPFPSMVGSGDRMALYWAVFGEAPSLREATKPVPPVKGEQTVPALHACQALSLTGSFDEPPQSVYHSCKGSNHCAAQGGCGFIQPVTGGGNCSQSASAQVLCGQPQLYGAPADNRCNGFGGCAVPISASQLYPDRDKPKMQLYGFDAEGHPVALKNQDGTPVTLEVQYGDSVYDTAWDAVEKVRAFGKDNYVPREKPPASDLRLALPPST